MRRTQRMDVTKRTTFSKKILQDGQTHLCQRYDTEIPCLGRIGTLLCFSLKTRMWYCWKKPDRRKKWNATWRITFRIVKVGHLRLNIVLIWKHTRQCQKRLVNKIFSDLLSPLKQKRDIFSDAFRFKRSTGSCCTLTEKCVLNLKLITWQPEFEM